MKTKTPLAMPNVQKKKKKRTSPPKVYTMNEPNQMNRKRHPNITDKLKVATDTDMCPAAPAGGGEGEDDGENEGETPAGVPEASPGVPAGPGVPPVPLPPVGWADKLLVEFDGVFVEEPVSDGVADVGAEVDELDLLIAVGDAEVPLEVGVDDGSGFSSAALAPRPN
jgi:hypothetical protein